MNPTWRDKPPRRKTYEDGNREQLHKAARDQAVAFLKELLKEDGTRLLKTLKPHEVDGLVENVLAGYHNALTIIENYETENWQKLRQQALKELDIFG